jgi:hypothetical protein
VERQAQEAAESFMALGRGAVIGESEIWVLLGCGRARMQCFGVLANSNDDTDGEFKMLMELPVYV